MTGARSGPVTAGGPRVQCGTVGPHQDPHPKAANWSACSRAGRVGADGVGDGGLQLLLDGAFGSSAPRPRTPAGVGAARGGVAWKPNRTVGV